MPTQKRTEKMERDSPLSRVSSAFSDHLTEFLVNSPVVKVIQKRSVRFKSFKFLGTFTNCEGESITDSRAD